MLDTATFPNLKFSFRGNQFHSRRGASRALPVPRRQWEIQILLEPFTWFRPIQATSRGFNHEIVISLYLFSIALRSYFRKFHRTSAASLSNSGTIHLNNPIEMFHMYAIILSILDVSFKWSHNTGLFCRHNASFVIRIGWSRFFRSSIRYTLIFGMDE